MSERRRMLMAIANSYKWLPYSYEYLYHNLIPEKIATFNKWNEEWELGYIDSTGNKASSGNIRSKDYIKVEPSGTYYFKCPISGNVFNVICYNVDKQYLTTKYPTSNTTLTMPSNCCYIRFYLEATYGTTYNHNICINESNASLNGTYIPYKPRYVKDKSKFAKFEGNSEVVNQLIEIPATDISISNFYGVDFTDNRNGTYLVNGTATGSNSYFTYARKDLKANHKYLLFGCPVGGSSSTYMMCFNTSLGANVSFDYGNGVIYTPTADDTFAMNIRVVQNGSATNKLFTPQLIDLTQMFPFDTPTTLTDSRVQNIIRKGYIPYNTGEIKDTDMGGIVARSFNLFDEETLSNLSGISKVGDYWVGSNTSWHADTLVEGWENIDFLPNVQYCATCYIKVPSSITYAYLRFQYTDSTFTQVSCEGGNEQLLSVVSVAGKEIKSIRITYGSGGGDISIKDFCINRSSSLNGTYKPFDDFVDLAHFNPIDINGIHDEFKALDSGYLFRKKTFKVDLGTLPISNFSTYNNHTIIVSTGNLTPIIKKPSANTTKGNIQCNGYTTTTAATMFASSNTNMSVAIATGGGVLFYNESYDTSDTTQLNNFISSLSGLYLNYEIETYQTTNMPLRHLGMVKLKDLTWNYSSGTSLFYSQDLRSLAKKPATIYVNANCYCPLFSNTNRSTIASANNQMCIDNDGDLDIRCDSYNNATDFKNHFTDDDYLYFETADITDETNILTYTSTLPIKYQGSGFGTSHDTMEETDTEWVFTRNCWEYVFKGNELWTSSNQAYYLSGVSLGAKGPDTNGTKANILCDILNPTTANELYANGNTSSGIALNTTGGVWIGAIDYANISNLTGKKIKYQLATPQIISIPKNRINVVDLGKVGLQYNSNSGFFYCGKPSDMKPITDNSQRPNLYCAICKTVEGYFASNMGQYDLSITINVNGNLYVCDKSKTQASDFNGIYLYYETTTESTLPDTFSIQAGGEVSSYYYIWTKNQQVTNGNFVDDTNNWEAYDSHTTTIATTNGKLTAYGGSMGQLQVVTVGIKQTLAKPFPNGHKILFYAKMSMTTDHGSSITLGGITGNLTNIQRNTYFATIGTASASTYFSLTATDSFVLFLFDYIMIIDLTVAGIDTTDINDYRIQDILEKGYVSTETNGVIEVLETEVLPNSTFSFKCK